MWRDFHGTTVLGRVLGLSLPAFETLLRINKTILERGSRGGSGETFHVAVGHVRVKGHASFKFDTHRNALSKPRDTGVITWYIPVTW